MDLPDDQRNRLFRFLPTAIQSWLPFSTVDGSPVVFDAVGPGSGKLLKRVMGTSAAGSWVRLPTGTLMTTPETGAWEYDGINHYLTNDTTSGRASVRNEHYFRLSADSGTLGPTIADYFGTNSAMPYVANGEYEVTYDLTFLKTTAATVTFTVLFSVAPTYGDFFMVKTPIAGAMTTGAPESMILTSTTSTTIVLGPTGSLTTAVNHHAQLKLYFVANTAGNVRLRITSGSGTVTARRGSRYFARRLPTANVGTFVA